MTTRQQMYEHLLGLLPASWVLYSTAREFDIDSGAPVYVALMRTKVEPAPNYLGAFIETFSVWIITTSQADDPALEDDLDTALDMALEALDDDNTLRIESAERDTYGQRQLHCWRIELSAGSARV